MFKKITVTIIGMIVGLAMYSAPVAAQAYPYGTDTTTVVASAAGTHFKKSWSWYIARASGVLAGILLVLLIISGVGLLTGYTYRLLEPLPAWAAHRALGISFGVLTLIHMFVLLFDKYIGFNLADILIPFHSNYGAVSIAGHKVSLFLAMGIVAVYAMVAVIVSSLLWMQSKPKPWRIIHYLSYSVLVLGFVHGLFAGTDLKHGFLRLIWIGGLIAAMAATLPRLRRAHTLDKE